jgi:hypothetical protein
MGTKQGLPFTVLRLVFLAGLGFCVFWTFDHAYWEADLRIPQRDATCIMDLPRAPAWSPPPLPAYAAFYAVFRGTSDALPKEQPMGVSMTRVAKLDFTLLDGSLYLWALIAATAVLYRIIIWLELVSILEDGEAGTNGRLAGTGDLKLLRARRDPVLHVVENVALGMTIAAISCVLLWTIGGGWGPPQPLLFASFGIAGGIAWGLLTLPASDPARVARSLESRSE